jgi:hypothetical protein
MLYRIENKAYVFQKGQVYLKIRQTSEIKLAPGFIKEEMKVFNQTLVDSILLMVNRRQEASLWQISLNDFEESN